jgi:hypothetical protein
LKNGATFDLHQMSNIKTPVMKYFFISLIFITLQNISCIKNKGTNCSTVTITNSAPGCGGWGIIVNGTKYPSGNIPTQFQQDGLSVCANYELYQDMRLCACCGGTWADIKSMSSN